jgi:hypothetical protein
MAAFRYLSGIIVFTVGLVVSIYAIIGYLFYQIEKHRKTEKEEGRRSERFNHESLNLFQRFCYGTSFETVYQSAWMNTCRGANRMMYLLLIWRIVRFGFFFGNNFIYGFINKGVGTAAYFSNWNIYLTCLFYFLASIASIIGITHEHAFQDHLLRMRSQKGDIPETEPFWSESLTKFGYALQILFEIGGSTAFFITVVSFTTVDPSFRSYWNVSEHFLTSVTFVVELYLNNMLIRWEHVLFTITWGLIYLIFVWPMVRTGAITGWPYFFLKTDKVTVFGWYIVLFAALMTFYYSFWALGYLKWIIVGKLSHKTETEVSSPVFSPHAEIEAPVQPIPMHIESAFYNIPV